MSRLLNAPAPNKRYVILSKAKKALPNDESGEEVEEESDPGFEVDGAEAKLVEKKKRKMAVRSRAVKRKEEVEKRKKVIIVINCFWNVWILWRWSVMWFVLLCNEKKTRISLILRCLLNPVVTQPSVSILVISFISSPYISSRRHPSPTSLLLKCPPTATWGTQVAVLCASHWFCALIGCTVVTRSGRSPGRRPLLTHCLSRPYSKPRNIVMVGSDQNTKKET